MYAIFRVARKGRPKMLRGCRRSNWGYGVGPFVQPPVIFLEFEVYSRRKLQRRLHKVVEARTDKLKGYASVGLERDVRTGLLQRTGDIFRPM